MKVGHDIETKRANWSFDGNVAETFVEHVRQSVPLYDAFCRITGSLVVAFPRPDR